MKKEVTFSCWNYLSINIFPSFQRNESELDPLEASATASSSLGADTGTNDAENPDGQSGKKKKNRCFSCKKKVGLTGKLRVIFPMLIKKHYRYNAEYSAYSAEGFLILTNNTFQVLHVVVVVSSAQCIVTVINTSATSTIRSWAQRK